MTDEAEHQAALRHAVKAIVARAPRLDAAMTELLRYLLNERDDDRIADPTQTGRCA